jgi:transposase
VPSLIRAGHISHTPMPNSSERIEVLSAIQRRRRYSLDEKLTVLAEAAQPGMSISYVARRHGISPSLLFGWRRRMSEGGKEAVRADESVVASSEIRALEKRVRELERVLGKKTLENEILREALKIAHEKKLISHLPSLPDGDTP